MHHPGGQLQHEPVEAEHHRLSGRMQINPVSPRQRQVTCGRHPGGSTDHLAEPTHGSDLN